MLVLKALHVLCMFGAVTLLVGEALVYARAIWRTDVPGLAGVHRLVGGRPVIAAALFMAGIVFGLLTALSGGFDVLAGWLIAAYVLVAGSWRSNASPWVQRLPRLGAQAADAEAGRRPPEDVIATMMAIRTSTMIVVGLNVVLFVAIILDMVLKPF
jgi:hypothetical protein